VAVVPGTHTFTDGIATSTEANAYIRDPINFLLAPPIARLRQATLQSIANAVNVSVAFDTEDLDTNVSGTAQHDNVTNNSRFTAVYAGWYSVGGGTGWAVSATNRRGNRFAVNGVAPSGTSSLGQAAAGTTMVAARREFVYLNVGDYVEMQAFQDSGGALNTSVAGDNGPTMTVRWVSN
jgi:hypothetical protein